MAHHKVQVGSGGADWLGRSTETGGIVKVTVQDERIVSVEQIEEGRECAGEQCGGDRIPWISPGW
ncbi:MAG: hypothetical protein K0Q59_5898, partial [Paenibacillus sp.]|nr:hypothetical protein [Paenibacillus sp.]